jgi:hypothetical protein
MIEGLGGAEALDACFPTETTYQAGASEIFVRTQIPLTHLRAVVFCDGAAQDHWLPIIRATQTLPQYDIAPPPRR